MYFWQEEENEKSVKFTFGRFEVEKIWINERLSHFTCFLLLLCFTLFYQRRKGRFCVKT
jgi:hypothetical protein